MSASYLDIALRFNGREVFTAAEAPSAASESQRTLNSANRGYSAALHATSTPKIDKPLISQKLTLTGATTIDLAAIAGLALPGAATRTVDLSGAKVKQVLFRTETTNNAGGINIAPGAANPYPLVGTANDFTLLPGQYLATGFAGVESTLATIAGGAKTLDLTPGASGDILYIELYAGSF